MHFPSFKKTFSISLLPLTVFENFRISGVLASSAVKEGASTTCKLNVPFVMNTDLPEKLNKIDIK